MSVPGNLYTPTIRKTRGGDYLIEQSLLFDGSTTYLNRTPSTAGNRKTWTYSVWFKKMAASTLNSGLFQATDNTGTSTWSVRTSATNGGRVEVLGYPGSVVYQVATNAILRDPNAWYHVVVAFDTTQSTASDRIKIWINGVLQTSLSVATYPTQNYDGQINNNVRHDIGYIPWATQWHNGPMALPILVDGAALDPTSFGEEDDDGYWNPIEFTGATTTDNVSVGGTASAESTFLTYVPANAFDGNTSTRWVSSATPAWLEYDRGSGNGVISTSYSISCGPSGTASTADMPKNWTIEGYNGSSWDTLATVTGEAAWSLGETRLYTFTNTTSYEKYRIDVTLQQGGGAEIEIGELTFYASGTGFGTNGFQLDYADTAAFGKDVSENTSAGGSLVPQGVYTHSTDAVARPTLWYDGNTSQGSTTGTYVGLAQSLFLRIDYGAGNSRICQGFEAWALTDDGFVLGSNTYGLQLQGSNDGSTWNNVASQVTGTDSAGKYEDARGITITDTTPYRYHQVVLTNETSPSNNVAGVAEVRFYAGDNDYTPINFTASDQLSDTPTDSTDNETGNFATLNPLLPGRGANLAEGNLRNNQPAAVSGDFNSHGTISELTSGKWYWEIQIHTPNFQYPNCGVWSSGAGNDRFNTAYSTGSSQFRGYAFDFGSSTSAGLVTGDTSRTTNTAAPWNTTFSANDFGMVALDLDNNKIYFGKNGTWLNSGVPAAGTGFASDGLDSSTYSYTPYLGCYGSATTINFGQLGFQYTPPTGFSALATQNLPAPSLTDPYVTSFTGNANADGPFIYIGGAPDQYGKATINGNAIIWGTHARPTAGGLKLITSSTDYNTSGSNTPSIDVGLALQGEGGDVQQSRAQFALNPGVFTYTGADQTYVVPDGVTRIAVKMWGAGGGDRSQDGGGGGGFVEGELAVTPGEELTIIVGQGGDNGSSPDPSIVAYGGGGRGTNSGGGFTSTVRGGGGGGRSAIRRSSTELATAGAGGGSATGGSDRGGFGGGLTGGTGLNGSGTGGTGGSQVAGGAAGGAAFAGGDGSGVYCAGGGGGYYGGGGGQTNRAAGGGGSSYIDGFVNDGSQTLTRSTSSGSGTTAGGTSDGWYPGSVGNGGTISGPGQNGYVHIYTIS
jgi:hypothetical protein